MSNIAIIPARSGSKGLRHKNIRLLNNLPLMAYSIIAAKESGLFDEILVSTDSMDYAALQLHMAPVFLFQGVQRLQQILLLHGMWSQKY